MKKPKQYLVGGISMFPEAYEKFVSLSKSEQVEYLSQNLYPTGDTVRAEKLLTHVPNGDISKGHDKETSVAEAKHSGKDGADNKK